MLAMSVGSRNAGQKIVIKTSKRFLTKHVKSAEDEKERVIRLNRKLKVEDDCSAKIKGVVTKCSPTS